MSSRSQEDAIYTVVSRPGPVEVRILEALSPALIAHRRIGADVSLRTLESGGKDAKSAPRVVFLHGRGHAATMWSPVAGALSKSHDVLIPDLPGFGHSANAPLESGDAEAGLAFFSEPIDALLPTDAPLVLVGHSLGGMVALDVALRRRHHIVGLVLVDAMGLGPVVSLQSRIYLRSGPERLARTRALFPWNRAPAHEGPSPILSDDESAVRRELGALRSELLTSRGGRPLASRAFNAMLGSSGLKLHFRERLHEIEQPVLLLWGDKDDGFPLPVAIDARARFPRATLETLPTGHSPHVEAPFQVRAIIERFVSMLSVARNE